MQPRKAGGIIVVALAAVVASGAAYRHFALVKPLLDEVRNGLTDPESAQFRNIRVFSDWTPRQTAICGEVNAKNRMGGYVGFKHFTAYGGGGAEIESDIIAELYDSGKLKRCDYAQYTPWWGVPF